MLVTKQLTVAIYFHSMESKKLVTNSLKMPSFVFNRRKTKKKQKTGLKQLEYE